MKGFWESVSHDALRVCRTVSFTLAVFFLFATAYLVGWHSTATVWTACAMFVAFGAGSLCNGGIASRKLFRSAMPHYVITVACWLAALYIALVM